MKIFEYITENGDIGYRTADGRPADTQAVLKLITLQKKLKNL